MSFRSVYNYTLGVVGTNCAGRRGTQVLDPVKRTKFQTTEKSVPLPGRAKEVMEKDRGGGVGGRAKARIPKKPGPD